MIFFVKKNFIVEDEYVVIIIEGYHDYDSDDEENLQIDREIQEEIEANHSDLSDNDDEEEEELSINDFKTFKPDQCVICLEEEPKVLFCNCGHLCICEKCLVRRFDNCPVCKEKNTILRIIE